MTPPLSLWLQVRDSDTYRAIVERDGWAGLAAQVVAPCVKLGVNRVIVRFPGSKPGVPVTIDDFLGDTGDLGETVRRYSYINAETGKRGVQFVMYLPSLRGRDAATQNAVIAKLKAMRAGVIIDDYKDDDADLEVLHTLRSAGMFAGREPFWDAKYFGTWNMPCFVEQRVIPTPWPVNWVSASANPTSERILLAPDEPLTPQWLALARALGFTACVHPHRLMATATPPPPVAPPTP